MRWQQIKQNLDQYVCHELATYYTCNSGWLCLTDFHPLQNISSCQYFRGFYFFCLHQILWCVKHNLIMSRKGNNTPSWKWEGENGGTCLLFNRQIPHLPVWRCRASFQETSLRQLALHWQTQTLRCVFKWGEGPSLSVRLCSQWRPTLIAGSVYRWLVIPGRAITQCASKYIDIHATSPWMKEAFKTGASHVTADLLSA